MLECRVWTAPGQVGARVRIIVRILHDIHRQASGCWRMRPASAPAHPPTRRTPATHSVFVAWQSASLTELAAPALPGAAAFSGVSAATFTPLSAFIICRSVSCSRASVRAISRSSRDSVMLRVISRVATETEVRGRALSGPLELLLPIPAHACCCRCCSLCCCNLLRRSASFLARSAASRRSFSLPASFAASRLACRARSAFAS